MKHRPLGRTGLSVSEICLGTMTWGSQNSEDEAHRQLDCAVDRGVTFIDTAEMYPTTPLAAETFGLTEEILGSWLALPGNREKVVLATKITGAGNEKVRGGAPITPETIREAIEGSLKRLRTDVVDLYQLHWPNRGSYHFRKSWTFDPSGQNAAAERQGIEDVLGALAELVAAGNIRHVGLSNETAWGTMQFLSIAEARGLPRMASIQNEYSVMHRIFDLDMAEVALNEAVGLLAYTPLAAGLLTGKYSGGRVPEGSRGAINKGLGGRHTPSAVSVADAYADIARRYGLDLAQMSLAFCLTRPFMTSVIIGATTMAQLETNIAAASVVLPEEALKDIAGIHRMHPIPM